MKFKALFRYLHIMCTVLNPFKFKQIYGALIEIERCREEYDSIQLDRKCNRYSQIFDDDDEEYRKYLLDRQVDLQFELEYQLKLLV